LAEIADQTIRQLESRIREARAQITVDFPPQLPSVEADSWRIEQVFFNLLTNALRYGAKPDTPAEIALRAWAQGGMVAIEVTDQGPGIPETDQPHVFERFYRVHKDRSRHAGGTGLGLSIVKNVVVAHGGHVEVKSQPGQGATFRIWLPRLRPRAGLPTPLPQK
jgi:signal transduction histidine kinase